MKNTLIAPIAERPDWYRIEDDTVVTRDKSGNAVSLFGDDAWNILAYTIGSRRTNLYFRGHTRGAAIRSLSDESTRQWKQVMYFGSVEFQVGCRACGLTAWKSNLPAIRKMTVLMVDRRVKPRARRLAAWNRPLMASRNPLV